MIAYEPKKNLPFRTIEDLEFPREVQIQTHTACNARCVMCPYGYVHKLITHGKMRDLLFRRIIDECAEHKVRDLKPFLMNEPLMDPRLPRLIRYARERLSEAVIGFSTNAQLLQGKQADELLTSGVDELWINFSGSTRKTYEGIMKGLSFERTRRNVLSFNQRVLKTGTNMRISISMVETRATIDEIEASKAFWRQYGIPVVTTPLNNRGGNVNAVGIRVLEHIKDYRVCDRPFYKTYIAYNGDVILCSSDWERGTIVGNVRLDGIYGVWHNSRQKQIREWLLNYEWSKLPLCKQCDYIAIYD